MVSWEKSKRANRVPSSSCRRSTQHGGVGNSGKATSSGFKENAVKTLLAIPDAVQNGFDKDQ